MLKNNASYVIEGEAGLKVRIGDRMSNIRSYWQVQRKFSIPESVYLQDASTQGCFSLDRGFIRSIKIIQKEGQTISSAAKVEQVLSKPANNLLKSLETYYGEKARRLRKQVYSFPNSGIAFQVRNNKLNAVFIFSRGSYPSDC